MALTCLLLLTGIFLHSSFYLLFFITSQEYIYYQVYKKLGLSHDGIMNYFTGPQFAPWNRMGNIKGWGGPITLTYLWNDLQLNKKVGIIYQFSNTLQIVVNEWII